MQQTFKSLKHLEFKWTPLNIKNKDDLRVWSAIKYLTVFHSSLKAQIENHIMFIYLLQKKRTEYGNTVQSAKTKNWTMSTRLISKGPVRQSFDNVDIDTYCEKSPSVNEKTYRDRMCILWSATSVPNNVARLPERPDHEATTLKGNSSVFQNENTPTYTYFTATIAFLTKTSQNSSLHDIQLNVCWSDWCKIKWS